MSRRHATIVCGNAGAGKTTYGQRLAAEQGAVLLDIDTVSERLVQAGLKGMGRNVNDRDSPEYKELFRDAIHDALFSIAAENLAHIPVVLVAPFTKERNDAEFPTLIRERLNSTFEIVYVTCDEEERRRRIVSRGNARDADKLKDWDAYAKKELEYLS